MKILFVHQYPPDRRVSFVEHDYWILREAHEVRECWFPGHRKGWFRLVKDIISLLRGVLWCDVTYSWFGKLHAFFAVLFSIILGRKSIVVSGGDDVAMESETGHGMFNFWWKRWCPLFVFKHADLILCVSEFNKGETLKYTRADHSKVELIHLGFDLDRFKRIPDVEKEDIAITVGNVNWDNYARKGHKLFVESAQYLPERTFVVVGPWVDGAIGDLKRLAPSNVIFTGGLYNDELVEMCNKAKVYVQASIYESFGCAVAEAMLCECAPVISRRVSLPEVVGDCGLYIDKLEPAELAQRIEEAMDSNLGLIASERIKKVFPLVKRRSELLAALEDLVS